MLIVVDIGNTNTVFAVYDGKEQLGSWRIATLAHRTSDEYGVWLFALLNHAGVESNKISHAIIATVVPSALFQIDLLCRQWLKVDPLIVSMQLNWGIEIHVDNPNEVGVDRLLDAICAYHKYKGPLIIVDFGTATTFDVVDERGGYRGGVIAPGINLSISALHSAAAQLPRIGIAKPEGIIAQNTIQAMLSGVYWGYIGLTEGIIGRIQKEYERELKVIATGGLATLLADATDIFDYIDLNLTLDGLKILADRNHLS